MPLWHFMLTDFLKRCKYDLLLLSLWVPNVLNLNMFLWSALIFSLYNNLWLVSWERMTGLNSREIYIEYHASELSPNLCNGFFFLLCFTLQRFIRRRGFFSIPSLASQFASRPKAQIWLVYQEYKMQSKAILE